MSNPDQLDLFPSLGFAFSDGGFPAPLFREPCSVSVAAVGRHIVTVEIAGGAL